MDRLAVIAAESQRFADVLADTDPERRCPSCPDWSASDLLWHLTHVHLFWAGILERDVLDEAGVAAVEQSKPARPGSAAELLALREQATASLVAQLARRDDSEPCWSWWPPDQTVGFTRRMQTYEATMHRVDAELAAGRPLHPIADDVAAGAIDHAVDVMWGWMPEGAPYEPDCVAEFVATDTGQRWQVEIGSWSATDPESGSAYEGMRAGRATGAEPTAVVDGRVNDLALWVWTRGKSVEMSGAPGTLATLYRMVNQGMQ